jgi:nucleoside-diphosphate-sugar epimerase
VFRAGGLLDHSRLEVVQGELRDRPAFGSSVGGCWAVIHLGGISEEDSYDLDPALGRSINHDCFEPIVDLSREAGVRRFIYASTRSVYSVNDADALTEEQPLAPLPDYGRSNCLCKELLPNMQSPEFTTTTLRLANVCGYSPRMRLDLAANALTNHAVHRVVMTVLDGRQNCPSIHVDDVAALIEALLSQPADRIAGDTLNVAHSKRTVEELAEIVRTVVEQEMPEEAS